MASMSSRSLRDFQQWRRSDFSLISTELALSRLGLKWEIAPEPCHDHRQFLKKSRDETLFCTASTQVTEIWDVQARQMLHRFDSPNTQTSCMDWLNDASFVTGGHDHNITLWREAQRIALCLVRRLTGHQDWIHGIGVNLNDTLLASGDCQCVLGLWDLPSMQNTSMTLLPRDPSQPMNSVMDLCFSKESPFVFYVLQRAGHLSLWDVRISEKMQWYARVHKDRCSYVKLCEDDTHLVTSSRGSELKLWDSRKIPTSGQMAPHLQIYNQHKSEKIVIGFDFLHYEEFIVSGSDDECAYIYEKNTGRLVRKVVLGPGQVGSAAGLDRSSYSFYAVYLSGRYLGVVDTEGENDIEHSYKSSDEIKMRYSKEAWETAFSLHHDRVISAARSAVPAVAMNYEDMVAAVRNSDLPECKALMRDLTDLYETNMKAATPRLVQDLQIFFEKDNYMKRKKRRRMKGGHSHSRSPPTSQAQHLMPSLIVKEKARLPPRILPFICQ